MILIEVVPRFERVFREVKVPMPNLTLAVVTLSDLACTFPYGVYAAAVLLPLTLTRLDQRTAGRVKLLSVVLFAGLLGFIALGLFLPFMGGLEGISARHR
jgi:type II secretory pathway component PulF